MIIFSDNIFKILPIVRTELYKNDFCFVIKTNLIIEILTIFKNHFKYQFKILTCISGVDYPENLYRFQLVYELLSLKYNSRLRIKVFIAELIPMETIESVYINAVWWECEIWDMFGVFFHNHSNLVRLLTDYGFQGYPLRKDFPLSGFVESKFNTIKNKVISELLELAQEYRVFDANSPWNTYIKK